MRELLAGLVPGLPDQVVERVLERAEGIPLYAVETVRMLLSEGSWRWTAGSTGRPAISSELSVPASLHALIASRLDGLEPADRSLLQAASVIGKTFSVEARRGRQRARSPRRCRRGCAGWSGARC